MKAKVTRECSTDCEEYTDVRRVHIYYQHRWNGVIYRDGVVTISEGDPLFAEALDLAPVTPYGYAAIHADRHVPDLDHWGEGIAPPVYDSGSDYDNGPDASQLIGDYKSRVLEACKRWPEYKDGWTHLPELANV